MRVGIIGGGVAGLSAAVALSGSGHEVVVFESRSRHQPSPRAGHVHRMDAAAWALLDDLIGPAGLLLPSRRVPFGLARGGAVAWRGEQRVTSLTELEGVLGRAARRLGAQLGFGAEVEQVTAEKTGWIVAWPGRPRERFDVLVDASGSHRVLLRCLGDGGPDVCMDEIVGPEWHMSLTGVSVDGPAQMIAWSQDDLEGLLQISPSGLVTLTARSGVAASLGPERIKAAVRHAGDGDLARLASEIDFAPHVSRYTSTGTRLMALEEADLSAWPPFVLIGDALIEAPPRHGEGVARAIAQARMLPALLDDGPSRCAAGLSGAARARWAGYGIARALRSGVPAQQP